MNFEEVKGAASATAAIFDSSAGSVRAKNYRLGTVLGSGTYHRTHYAKDQRSQREVIIKIIDEEALAENKLKL